jgi:S1-C subfamily serine protease
VFSGIAERVRPHVVGVSGYVRDPEWSADKAKAQHGDDWVVHNPDALRYPGYRLTRTGSGFLVDADGYVLSADQILRDPAGEVVSLVDIELSNEAHVPAAIVATEPTLDLAVLRIADPSRLPPGLAPIERGDSGYLQVGHWVVAVADPPGPEFVFSVGVVASPPERQCYQEHLSATAVQTSLNVPVAGVGGPVVDILGHVVGISVGPSRAAGIASPADAAPARVITLPINLVSHLFETLRATKTRQSPWLGISVLERPAWRAHLGTAAATAQLPDHGIAIDNVFHPSPASTAGVQPGDFLLQMGGHPIESVGDFQTWLYALGIGARAELKLWRAGSPLAVVAAIELRPDSVRPK